MVTYLLKVAKVSLNFLWEDDSKKEVYEKLNSKAFYITTGGKMAFSAAVLTNDIMLSLLTEKPE